jgi:hypothetical protein
VTSRGGHEEPLPPGFVRWRRALYELTVPVTGRHLRALRHWEEVLLRHSNIDEPWPRPTSWYFEIETAWLLSAQEARLWMPSRSSTGEWTAQGKAPPLVGSIRSLTDQRGVTVSTRIESRSRRALFRAEYSGRRRVAVPLEKLYRDRDRLTYQEFLACEACRTCGKPLRLPNGRRQTKRARDREHAWWRQHNDASHTHGGWRCGDGQPTHCVVCCPPPPVAPATLARIATILSVAPSSEPPGWSDSDPSGIPNRDG